MGSLRYSTRYLPRCLLGTRSAPRPYPSLSEIRSELTLRVPAALEERIHVLDEHPNYPERLRGKILQAADGLFRAAEMDEGLEG